MHTICPKLLTHALLFFVFIGVLSFRRPSSRSFGLSAFVDYRCFGDRCSAPLQEGTIPAETFRKAQVTTLDEALAAANRIGYPVMVKASEGGGGKGIRMSHSDEDMRSHFVQVRLVRSCVGSLARSHRGGVAVAAVSLWRVTALGVGRECLRGFLC